MKNGGSIRCCWIGSLNTDVDLVNQWIVLVLLKIPVYVKTQFYLIWIKTFRGGVIVTILVTVMLIILSALGTFGISYLMTLFLLGIVIGTVIPYILILKIKFLRLIMIILFYVNLKVFFYSYKNFSYLNNVSKSDDPDYDHYMYDTKYSWNNHINNCIDSYLRSQIRIDGYILGDSDKYNDSYIYSYICGKGRNISERGNSSIITHTNATSDSDLTRRESSNDLEETKKYRHLWIQCENCYGLNYKKVLKSKMNICEHCGYHLQMSSSDRIELLIDRGTWNPMDEDMVSGDPIEFHSEEEPYKDRIYSYQRKTGLTDAVQTGTGQLNGIPVAIGVMDFQFMGGSMGSVVGEKITRLIEYAANQFLPLILVCASGGARMQEGSLSLMQMAKISSALYDYQANKKLFYVSILTSPTTGGVTASFGMLGDIIIAEPNAYIAFAGKRVIEQTLNKTVPEGSQAAEYLFHKGLFDLIVPRNLLKGILSELFQLHAFFPLTPN
uniref:Acetyl-coenzyme A carboxylase carboxyl transferase subunit beta, chloroplastic n=1 Tax=Vachellia nilotica TaxID=138033 RepID=A0A650F327_9FABA|nr:acetyl-CoA carboxylase carboxyltransferase beta subunit [Vachellia nilotica]QGT77150.1 acetyl-CoA carboxylase carboxyltransferase beta subunit [Vachellia nilotica]